MDFRRSDFDSLRLTAVNASSASPPGSMLNSSEFGYTTCTLRSAMSPLGAWLPLMAATWVRGLRDLTRSARGQHERRAGGESDGGHDSASRRRSESSHGLSSMGQVHNPLGRVVVTLEAPHSGYSLRGRVGRATVGGVQDRASAGVPEGSPRGVEMHGWGTLSTPKIR